MPAYKKLMAESTKDPAKFWAKQAKSLHWIREFDNVTTGSFAEGDINWFAGGKLNVCANALDRHVWDAAKADQPCIVWEGDEVGTGKTYTFRQALREVCRIANVLKSLGVRKGDAVTLYMPMVPEGVFAMLACARLGARPPFFFSSALTNNKPKAPRTPSCLPGFPPRRCATASWTSRADSCLCATRACAAARRFR